MEERYDWDRAPNSPAPIKQGLARSRGSETCYPYMVFDRAAAEAALSVPIDNPLFAELLTGWHYEYRGLGRSFAGDPVLKVFGKKILVYQMRGLDV